jgi:hypothetical protein
MSTWYLQAPWPRGLTRGNRLGNRAANSATPCDRNTRAHCDIMTVEGAA